MTKKIKFLKDYSCEVLAFKKDKIYEILKEDEYYFSIKDETNIDTPILKNDYDYEIIEETKPVKKYIKFSDLKHTNPGDFQLDKWHEVLRETSEHDYVIKNKFGDDTCIDKAFEDYQICEGHPHADLIQYAAELAKQTMDVGSHFQYKDGITGEWVDWGGTSLPNFNPEYEYRIKPKTIKIGDVEINAPEREPLEIGQKYYIAYIADGTWRLEWEDNSVDKVWLEKGLVFLCKEDAEAAIEAILKLLEDK